MNQDFYQGIRGCRVYSCFLGSDMHVTVVARNVHQGSYNLSQFYKPKKSMTFVHILWKPMGEL